MATGVVRSAIGRAVDSGLAARERLQAINRAGDVPTLARPELVEQDRCMLDHRRRRQVNQRTDIAWLGVVQHESDV